MLERIDAVIEFLGTPTVDRLPIDTHTLNELRWDSSFLREFFGAPTNQQRVTAWVRTTFTGAEAENIPERALRTAEEVLELAQACNVDAATLHRLVDYVFSRPVGKPAQEIAGSMVCLYATASALGADADAEFETELARIQQPEVIERCRRRQHEKREALAAKPEQYTDNAFENFEIHARRNGFPPFESPPERGARMLDAYNRERDAGLDISDSLDKIGEEFPEVSGTNVHILFHGLPLCDFSRDVPALWPKGHLWVRVEEREKSNCQGCLLERKPGRRHVE